MTAVDTVNKVGTSERRDNNRVPLNVAVQYSLDDQTWQESRSRDISAGGICLQGRVSAGTGQTLHLNFELPDVRWQGEINLQAEVVRIVSEQGQQQGVGLRFVSLKSDSYEDVKDFVEQVLGLPLPDEIQSAGEEEESGGYTFDMERLIQKSLERETMMEEGERFGRLSATSISIKNRNFKIAFQTLLILGAGYACYELFRFIAEYSAYLKMIRP